MVNMITIKVADLEYRLFRSAGKPNPTADEARE